MFSKLISQGKPKALFTATNGVIRNIVKGDLLTTGPGNFTRLGFRETPIAQTKRYEAQGAAPAGTGTKKCLETVTRVFNGQLKECRADDPMVDPHWHDSDTGIGFKKKDIAEQLHVFKPCGVTKDGAMRKYMKDMMHDFKINSKDLQDDYVKLIQTPVVKLAEGKSTLSLRQCMTTATSAKALKDVLDTLNLNGISPSLPTIGSLCDSVLELLSRDVVFMKTYDPRTQKETLEQFSREEFYAYICTAKPVLKGEEKGKMERRAIWIVTMWLKVLMWCPEAAAQVLLIRVPYDCICIGGLEKEEKIYSTVNAPEIAQCPFAYVISNDKTKWNENIVESALWEGMDVIVKAWHPRYKIQCLSGIKAVCNKLLILPSVKLYADTGHNIETAFSDLNWVNLSPDWKKDAFADSEEYFKMIKNKLLVFFDKDITRCPSFMGMGIVGKCSTYITAGAVHQAIRNAKPGVYVRILVASDDSVVVIGADSFEDCEEMAIAMMAAEKTVGITTSPSKTIIQSKLCGQEPQSEFTTWYINGTKNQTPATQKSGVIKLKHDTYGGAMTTLSTAPKTCLANGGLMPGLMSHVPISEAKSLISSLGYNEDVAEELRTDENLVRNLQREQEYSESESDDEDITDFDEFMEKKNQRNIRKEERYNRMNKLEKAILDKQAKVKKRRKYNRTTIAQKVGILGKTVYTDVEQITGPLTCSFNEEYGIMKGKYDPIMCAAARVKDRNFIDQKLINQESTSNYNLKAPASLSYLTKQTKQEKEIEEEAERCRMVYEAFWASNPRLAGTESCNVNVRPYLLKYIEQHGPVCKDPSLKADCELAIDVLKSRYNVDTEERLLAGIGCKYA